MTERILGKFNIRLDPWSPDFGASFQTSEDAEEAISEKVQVDTSVEVPEREWRALSAAIKLDVDNLGTLAQDLQNNRLQNYVVGRLLEILIETCNRTLKDLTRNRYTLDLNEKENMIVRNSWNGDEQRPVETLSGGETFVIALSLALSLSEFMKGGVSLESLFIDEGFSNLDRQRLDLVSDAIGNLPLYGKVVGVITHLEELAERFPVRVHVKNSPEGSSVTVSAI